MVYLHTDKNKSQENNQEKMETQFNKKLQF